MNGVLCAAFTLCVVLAKNGVAGRTVPFTPCPKLFNYFESETYEIFGAMTFKNDLGGKYNIEVNMSIATTTDENIRIFRKTPDYRIQNGEDIEYYVLFPYNHTFPKLTSVTFNGKLYCVGPPEEANKDHGVTPLSKTDSLSVKIVDALLTTAAPPLPNMPFIQIVINQNVINEPECGRNYNHAEPGGEYPWLAAIFLARLDGGYTFICGGSLVSKSHIVTAAHCMRNSSGLNLPINDLVIVLGKHNLKKWVHGATIRSVKHLYVHPEYRKPCDADVAMLMLDEPVSYRSTVKPLCLWDEVDDLDDVTNVNGTLIGWGQDEIGKNYTEAPKRIQMPIVSQETCLRSDARYIKLTSSRTFCSGSIGDSCLKDVDGSGLVLNRNGVMKLRGVMSTAFRDSVSTYCDVHNYAVFADVAKYIPWIQKVMGV